MKDKSKVVLVVFLFVTGALTLIFGLVFKFILDKIIDNVLREKLALKDGTIAYKMWLEPPVPVKFAIYVFDVVNIDEVLAGREQPAVVEKGPYVHRMTIHKTNISRHDFNDTIAYVQPQEFHFDEEASVGPLSDTFTNINIPYITMASILQYYPAPMQTMVNAIWRAGNETAFKKLSVHDIFWGYKDPVLAVMVKMAKAMGMKVDYLTEKFGFFADKNNTGDGYYNVFSAVNGNLDNYNKIDFWNRQRKLNIWTTDKANEIAGTDGSMHPPYVSSDSKLKIFDAYLHRTLNMEYVKESSYKGLDTLHFVVPFREFGNATVNPDAAGFCTPNTNSCMPSGCYNLSVASFGAPMYVSMPHFCGGDPYYQQQVLGLHPDPEKHQPYYDIHGLTGVSIKGSRRYQINVQMKSYKHFTPYNKVPLAYLPVIWIDGISVIDDDNVSQFRDDIQHLLEAMVYVRGFLIGIGAVILCVSICLGAAWYYKYKKGESKQDPQDDSTGKNVNDQVESEKKPLLKNGH